MPILPTITRTPAISQNIWQFTYSNQFVWLKMKLFNCAQIIRDYTVYKFTYGNIV